MLTRLDRYLLREVAQTSVAVPGVLLALAVVGGATAYARGRGGDGGP